MTIFGRILHLLHMNAMAAALLAGVCLSAADAKIFYVSPTGNDHASGAMEHPWHSIQHAADTVAPGDRVRIDAGVYAERVIFRISGRAGAPIEFSVAPGQTVSVKGLEFAKGTSHITVTNLRIEGFSVWGVSLEGKNHHVSLGGLYVKGGEAGLHFSTEDGPVSNVVVENSHIVDSIYTAVDCTPGPCNQMNFRHLEVSGAGLSGEINWGADGIAVERGRDIVVEDCFIHDNAGDGIDLNSRDTAGHASGIIVRRNKVVRNRRNGIKLWAGGQMMNNAIWGQGGSAVVLGDWPGTYRVMNNTIAYNMWDASYSERNYSLVVAYPAENGVSPKIELTLRNNVFAFNSGPSVGGPTGIYLGKGVHLKSEGRNVFWSQSDNEIVAQFVGPDREFSRSEINNGDWAAVTHQGAGDLARDPMLAAGWPHVDIRLRINSPAAAIGAGATRRSP